MTPRLPIEEQREWLTLGLAELVARAGWRRFVGAPPIEPTDSFFPDRYEHGPLGVRTVARRFLRHAGIEDLGVRESRATCCATTSARRRSCRRPRSRW